LPVGSVYRTGSLSPYASFRWQTQDALFAKPYNLHPYQYAYSNPVLHTDPTGLCVPDEDSPHACNPTFTSSLRNFLRYSSGYEQRPYRGGDPINGIFDRFPAEARSYQPLNDQTLLSFLQGEGFDVEPTLGYLNVRLTQWRLDDAQQNNLATPDLGPMTSGMVILGVANGGLDCFLSPDTGGGGGSRYSFSDDPFLQEGNLKVVIGDGPKGQVRIMGTFTTEGDTLYIRGAHIEGPGATRVGYQDILEYGRQYGRQQGVKEVIIEGQVRTTGARPGHTPRPIIIKVE